MKIYREEKTNKRSIVPLYRPNKLSKGLIYMGSRFRFLSKSA